MLNWKADLKTLLRRRLFHALPEGARRRLEPFWATYEHSYSQYGEDSVARAYFDARPKDSGFYVDIGAHDPIVYSNTYFFYRRGWRGINIDATPGSMRSFQQLRPRDINLEIAIAEKEEELTFFVFKDQPLENTSNPKHAELVAAKYGGTPRPVSVTARPLRDVLADHLPPSMEIDLLSVDVEGLDAVVLRSNDWDKYRPKLILVEAFVTNIEEIRQAEVYELLRRYGYSLYAWAPWTLFFVETDRT